MTATTCGTLLFLLFLLSPCRFLDTRLCTSQTYWHQLPMYPLDLHCMPRRLSRTRRRIGVAFSVAASRAWNMLPTELKLLQSTTTFRRQLKTFFDPFCPRTPGNWWLFCDVPSVFSRRCSTNESVTVTVCYVPGSLMSCKSRSSQLPFLQPGWE